MAKEQRRMEKPQSRRTTEEHALQHRVRWMRIWVEELRRKGNEEDLESSLNS